jgi:hypothetical protein
MTEKGEAVILRIDALVEVLEAEGYPLAFILEEMTDYVELARDTFF